jgi:hypothetical protein
MAAPFPARGQVDACTQPPALPAYAHNDYANARPLSEALELGFRGIEADVLLRGGELRVGHDAGDTRAGRSLEALYLRPLRARVRQCGWVIAGGTPFLLNVELKERSRAGYDSLLRLVTRYRDLIQAPDAPAPPPVEIVLVGWHPPLGSTRTEVELPLWRQQRITALASPGVQGSTHEGVRLVSLDYGKTVGWSGRGPVPKRARQWLTALRAARDAASDRLARVYNVPVDPSVYRLLLDAGVDLIGTKRLAASAEVLRSMKAPSLP